MSTEGDLIFNPPTTVSLHIHPVTPDTTLRIIVGITCSLSIIGSLVIILSYIGFKQLRTTTRLILVHISVMDFGVAAANLVGTSVDFNKYYFDSNHGNYSRDGWPIIVPPKKSTDVLCQTQAAVAVFSTSGSILWTLCMSIYLYFRIVHHVTPSIARLTLWASTFFCYFLPSLFVVWTLFTNRLGYSPYDSEGWCGERMVNIFSGERQIILSIIGYDLWICLIYFLVPILYISILLYIRQELKRSAMFITSERFWKAVHSLDFKLLLIPLAFLLLRAMGDSGQGFVNAILFVLLAKKVRSTLIAFVCCRKTPLNDETSQLIFGTSQEQEGLYPRENTPHIFTSSRGSSSSSDDNDTTYSCSYKSIGVYTTSS